MSKFSVVVKNTNDVPFQLSNGLVINPTEKMSFNDVGGPDSAILEAYGTLEQIANLANMLRYGVEIRNMNATPIWWGFINEVEINIGEIILVTSLDNLTNKVKVKYSYRDANGNFSSSETSWYSDATSIYNYGTKELLNSIGEGHSAGAVSAAGVILEQQKQPIVSIKKSSARDKIVRAKIRCKGWIHILEWRYCQIDRGFDEYYADTQRSFLLGFSRTSANVSFTASSRKIEDTGYDFGLLEAGDFVKITGSTSNNGTFTIDTVSQNSITVVETIVDEALGASVTIASPYTKMSQIFQIAESYEVDKIAVYIQKIGTPSSSIALDITTDSSGVPSATILQTATLLPSSVDTTLSSQEFTFSGYTLSSATNYHLVIRSIASISDANFYRVGYDYQKLAAPYGHGDVYNGSSWVAPFNFELPYVITDKLDTIKQIKAIFSEFGQVFSSANYVSLSGVKTNQWRDGKSTALAEVQKLVEIGNSTGSFIYIEITPNRDVIIKIQETENPIGFAIDSSGRFRYANGGICEPGMLFVGIPIRLIDIPKIAADLIGSYYVIFERCDYDFETNTYDWVVKNASNRFKFASITRG